MSTKLETIISNILEYINVTNCEKVTAFDSMETANGAGAITVQVIRTDVMNPGLPDYRFVCSVMGQTYISEDSDGAKIKAIASECMADMEAISPATIDTKILAKFIKGFSFSEDESKRYFTLEFDLIASDIVL